LTPISSPASADEGIAVSVATLIDLWYVTQTTRAVSPEQLTAITELLADPTSPLDAIPIDTSVTAAFEAIPLPLLRDPWDRLITATESVSHSSGAWRTARDQGRPDHCRRPGRGHLVSDGLRCREPLGSPGLPRLPRSAWQGHPAPLVSARR